MTQDASIDGAIGHHDHGHQHHDHHNHSNPSYGTHGPDSSHRNHEGGEYDDNDDLHPPSERTRLLTNVPPIPDPSLPEPQPHTHKPPPLPIFQLIILCSVRLAEPIIFFSIFPYIAQMVSQNGHLPPEDVGFWSGLIESVFSLTQMITLLFWGRMADRIGRKPTLVISLLGMAVCPLLFGISRSLTEMIVYRSVAGCFTGSTLVVRTMIAELSTPKTQARAFSWFAVAGNIGILVGPILGGSLVDPVHQYPRLFGNNRFFKKYPYSLPGFATGVICLLCAIINLIFIKETLPKEKTADQAPVATDTDSNTTTNTTPEVTKPSLIKAPNVALVLYTYNHIMALAFSFTALLPVYLYTPVDLGGIGLSSFHISLYIALQGASQAIWLLLVFPIMQRRFGTRRLLQLCAAAYPFFFLGAPLLNLLLRVDTKSADVIFWILGFSFAVLGPGVSMAFTGIQLALNDVAPSPQVLGTLNGMALTIASGVRTVVPAATTALFAIGVKGQILGGQLIWAVLVPLAAGFWVISYWLPEDKQDEDE